MDWGTSYLDWVTCIWICGRELERLEGGGYHDRLKLLFFSSFFFQVTGWGGGDGLGLVILLGGRRPISRKVVVIS